MKQTRADMLGVGVYLHSADHPGAFRQHGTVRAMSRQLVGHLVCLKEIGDNDNQSTCSPSEVVEIV